MSDKPMKTADQLLEEAKKKVADVAEEYFNAIFAERLSQLADGAAAQLNPTAKAEVETAAREEAAAAAEAECAEEIAAAEAAVEAAEEAPAAVVEEAPAAAVEETVEAVVEEAPAAPAAHVDDESEPYCIHFEDEDDEYDENGDRIPAIPYNN